MKEKRLLFAIGEIDDAFIQELTDGYEVKNPMRVRRAWLVAAIVAALLVLLGCAAYILRMQDLVLGQGEVIETEDWISLQGFVGSNNYQAAKEWFEFQQTYDPEGEIMQSLSNEEMIMPEAYWSYQAYTPEMTAKIDEICQRYGLNTLGMPKMGDSMDHFYDILKINRILRENADAEIGLDYYYRSGTFMLHGKTVLAGGKTVEFQYRCVMKTDFDGVFLNVGNIEDYDQWVYTTADGTEVLLAIGEDKSLMIVDREAYFVTVNIPESLISDEEIGDQPMNREAMEAFAEIFDFSYCPKPVSDADWETVLNEPTPEEKEAELSSVGGEGYASRVQYLMENASRPEMLDYAMLDLNGDGSEELLIARRGRICYLYTMDGGAVTDLLWYPVARNIYHYGWEETGLYTGPSYMVLCEGNTVACVYEETGDGGIRQQIWKFAVPVDGEMVWMEEIGMDLNGGDPLYYEFTEEEGSHVGYNNVCSPITEERFGDILDSYIRVEVEWTPLSEYPAE